MKNIKEFKPIINLFKEYKGKIILCSITIFLGNLSYLLVGYLNGASIEAITNLNLKLSIIFLLIYLISEITFNAIKRISTTTLSKIELNITRKISFLTYKKALCLPAYAYEEKSSGELINRITNDTEIIINSFDQLIDLFAGLFSTLIILIFIFINSYIVGLEILAFILIYAVIVKKFNPKLKNAHKEIKELSDAHTSMVTESLKGVREIKTLGIKNSLFKNLRELLEKLVKKAYYEVDLYRNYDILSNVLKAFLEVGTFITCAILLYYDKCSLTFFIAMTYYIYRYTWLVENITSFTKIYNQVLVSVTRINEIMENKLYDDVTFGNVELKECRGEIKFENVTFNYPNEGNVLNDFSATFIPNKKIGIVGKSGQGKSTIFNLLTRIFDSQKGKITIDGINIQDLTEDSLRKNVSIIRQEPFLFNKTIKENFYLLNAKFSLDEIRKFCKMAYIDDYIMSLPKQYDTILGEGGVNLSGGQKQRLSIARALAKESKIILFDEATSSLDNESQKYIKQVIDNLIEDHTIIIVAHRLSTIKDADIIYIIDEGKICDSGTHKELMEKSNFYKKLYTTELE